MTTCDTGDVVLVRYPFTNPATTKQRPAVIVSSLAFARRNGDCVLMPLTTQSQHNGALALARWQQAGLAQPTWVKPLIGTLSRVLLIRPIGQVTPEDDPAIRAALAEVIDVRW